jgi:hypothetical protein
MEKAREARRERETKEWGGPESKRGEGLHLS